MRVIAGREYMDLQELGTYLGLSYQTAKSYRKKSNHWRLPRESLNTGNKPFWLQKDVDRWVESLKIKGVDYGREIHV